MATTELPVSPVVTLVAQRVAALNGAEKDLSDELSDLESALERVTAELSEVRGQRNALTRWLAENAGA